MGLKRGSSVLAAAMVIIFTQGCGLMGSSNIKVKGRSVASFTQNNNKPDYDESQAIYEACIADGKGYDASLNACYECTTRGEVFDPTANQCIVTVITSDDCKALKQAFDPVLKRCVNCELAGKIYEDATVTCADRPPTAEDCHERKFAFDAAAEKCVDCAATGKIFNDVTKLCMDKPESATSCKAKGQVLKGAKCEACPAGEQTNDGLTCVKRPPTPAECYAMSKNYQNGACVDCKDGEQWIAPMMCRACDPAKETFNPGNRKCEPRKYSEAECKAATKCYNATTQTCFDPGNLFFSPNIPTGCETRKTQNDCTNEVYNSKTNKCESCGEKRFDPATKSCKDRQWSNQKCADKAGPGEGYDSGSDSCYACKAGEVFDYRAAEGKASACKAPDFQVETVTECNKPNANSPLVIKVWKNYTSKTNETAYFNLKHTYNSIVNEALQIKLEVVGGQFNPVPIAAGNLSSEGYTIIQPTPPFTICPKTVEGKAGLDFNQVKLTIKPDEVPKQPECDTSFMFWQAGQCSCMDGGKPFDDPTYGKICKNVSSPNGTVEMNGQQVPYWNGYKVKQLVCRAYGNPSANCQSL